MISPPVMGPVLINNMLRFHFLRIQETQFLEYIEIEKGRAINTVKNYDRYLTLFLAQTKIKDPKDITNEKLEH